MSRTSALAVRLALLLVLVVISGCGGDGPAPDGPEPQVDLAAAEVGETVTVYGTVSDVETASAFGMEGAIEGGGTLLVVGEDPVTLRRGARVEVTGTVEALDAAARDRHDLTTLELSGVSAEKYLLASKVDVPTQGDVVD